MLNAKTGDWFINNPQRGRSNNSCMLLRNSTTKEELDHIMESVKEVGEPGFIFADDLDALYNPCVTADTSVMTNEGPKLVSDLVNRQFTAVVNGKEYPTTDKGFWKTGTKFVYKLTLANGMELKLTDNHKVLTKNKDWVMLKDLTINDDVIIHNHTDYIWGKDSKTDEEEGWLVGSQISNGTFDSFSIFENNKIFNHTVEEQSYSFYKGYLSGLFDTNSLVQEDQNKGISIKLTQSSISLLRQVQRMLNKLGITSKIYKNKHPEGHYNLPDNKGNGDTKKYYCKATHELVISNESVTMFSKLINFKNEHKQDKLNKILANYKRTPNSNKYYSKIASIEAIGHLDVYDVTVPGPEAFDANGLYVHNCVEIGMRGYTKDNKSGWQMCNLAEINGKLSHNPETFYNQCKTASIIGTIQASYTDFKFLGKASKEIIEEEALIGVGVTGWMNEPDVLFDEKVMAKGAEIVKYWNKKTAELININQAARTTTVKPSGNASVLLGCASGIHGEHSPKYFRHVQFNKETEIAKLFMKNFPYMCETSVWNKDKDIVIAFPIETPKNSIYKKELLGVKQLEYVKKAQDVWIEQGTNYDLCIAPWLRHNVSNTITVDDWEEVTDYVYNNRYSFCGISFLSALGDKAYPQAPFTEVHDYQDIINMYGQEAMFASGLIEAGLNAFNNDLWNATATVAGYGEKLTDEHKDLMKRDFVRRFRKFSKHFNSQEECSACLKDVYNLHKWWKIQDKGFDVDWTESLTQKEYVDIDTLGAQACSGGQCEINF